MPDPVALISCVSKKLDHPAPAGEIYVSDWFQKARAYAEATCPGGFFILSALYGLLEPSRIIRPYEKTLIGESAPARKQWAMSTALAVNEAIPAGTPLVILAGQAYRQHLLPRLQTAGYPCSVPMQGLGIGQQLAFLKNHRAQKIAA